MSLSRRALAALAVLVLAVVVAGCGAEEDSADRVRSSVQRVQSALGRSDFALPSIVVEIAPSGDVERVGGFDAEFVDDVFESWFGWPLVGRLVKLDRAQVERLDRAGIRLITVASRPEGLFVLVNGHPLPHVAWDDDAFANLEAFAAMMVEPEDPALADEMFSLFGEESYQDAEVLLEILRTVNLRVDVRIPDLAEADEQEIPLPGDEAFGAALSDVEIEAEPLQTVDLTLDYEPIAVADELETAWVPSVFGMNTIELQAIAGPTGNDIPELRLPDDVRRRLEYEGIVDVGLEAREDGLYLAVNGHRMPHVAWNETTLVNLSDVLVRLYPEGADETAEVDWLDVVQSSAPMYNDYAVSVLVRFPIDAATPAAEIESSRGS